MKDVETWTRIISPWIAIIFITVGWYISHASANTRERRKEIRSAIDRFREDILDLKNNAVNYHTAEKHNPLLALKIKSSLQNLSLINCFEISLRSDNLFSEAIADVTNAITFHNFDSPSTFSPQAFDGEIILEIDACIDLAYQQVEESFHRFYFRDRNSTRLPR